MRLSLIHKEWKDDVILNFEHKTLNRLNIIEETADYKLINNKIYIKWHKWNEEIFIRNNNIFYYCEKIIVVNKNIEEILLMDKINNLIYKENSEEFGNFEYSNDELIINWNFFLLDKLKDEENIIPNIIPNIIEDNNKINLMNLNNKIPKIIHFIFGFKEQKEEFELYRYIAIKSAYEVNRPTKIYFYYYYEPFGFWWDKIKPILTLEKIEPPTEIFGNPVLHYAHQADIIRIKKLIQYGGIYLDIDTICLKSFDDLLDYDFVMGLQNNSDNTKIYGLCNAVILSKPDSIFCNKWLESYQTFNSKGRDEFWDEHSVLKPYELSKLYSKDIKILNTNAFFYPLWYDIKDVLFNNNINIDIYKNIIKENYTIHLWDTYTNSYLKNLDQEFIFNNNTLYNIISRKFLRNKISIVFLTYHRFEKTKKCLNSFLQIIDHEDLQEIIILDNNSNTELTDYLNIYQENNDKIKLIFSNENLGVCLGRIVLFKEAKGDIIISLDSDTILLDREFINKVKFHLYDESNGIVGIAGSYIKSWEFGTQIDIDENDENEYIVDHISGCCQAFRKDLFNFGFELDLNYGKFWVEDTDLSMQSLYLNKNNYRINPKKFIEHHWGGSGKDFKDLFEKNWNYLANKWKNKVLLDMKQ
jgi:mannosyltransferase OCH1-like enzyme